MARSKIFYQMGAQFRSAGIRAGSVVSSWFGSVHKGHHQGALLRACAGRFGLVGFAGCWLAAVTMFAAR